MHEIINFVLFIIFSKDNLGYVMYMPTKLVFFLFNIDYFLKNSEANGFGISMKLGI
jgi:hypothetical protein